MALTSIIIPVSATHNRKDILGACLKSFGNQTYPKEKLELIIIGDGCKVTRELCPPNINTKIFNFTNHAGLAAVRNKGIEIAQGEAIVFIDADCVAQEAWIANLIKGIESDNVAACAGAVLDSEKKCQNKKWVYAQENYLPFTSLGNAIFRRQVLEEAGLFDEQFSNYMEDIDLCWRVCLKGYRIKYIPEAVVTHNEGGTAKKSFSKGLGARLIENKYRKLLRFSHCQELKKLWQIKNDFSMKGTKKYFFFSCGYICALLKEWVRQSTKPELAELTEQFLQSPALLKPLNLAFDGKKLIKPNYIIWWKTNDGARLLDVNRNREFTLQNISGKMWQYMMDGMTEELILRKILDEYEVPDKELKEDFEKFIEYLFKEEILAYSEELRNPAAKIQSFIYFGESMNPFLTTGDIILAENPTHKQLRFGDIVVYHNPERAIIHRFLYCKRMDQNIVHIVSKGDNSLMRDKPFDSAHLIGKALLINKRRGQIKLDLLFWRIISNFIALVSLSEALLYENARHIKLFFFKEAKTNIFMKKFISRIMKIPIFLLSKMLIYPYR